MLTITLKIKQGMNHKTQVIIKPDTDEKFNKATKDEKLAYNLVYQALDNSIKNIK